MQPVHEALERDQQRLSIDRDHAAEILTRLPPKSNLWDSQNVLIRDIVDRDFHLSIGTYGRVFNNISCLKRELRQALRLGKDPLIVVHVEEFNSSTSDGGETDDPIPAPNKMFVPVLRSGVKQRDQHAIDTSSQICSLVKIAPVAGKAQIGILIGAAVLLRDHMFDVKRNQRQSVLMTSAVLATIPGTLPD